MEKAILLCKCHKFLPFVKDALKRINQLMHIAFDRAEGCSIAHIFYFVPSWNTARRTDAFNLNKLVLKWSVHSLAKCVPINLKCFKHICNGLELCTSEHKSFACKFWYSKDIDSNTQASAIVFNLKFRLHYFEHNLMQ